MPSWGIHLKVADELSKNMDSKEKEEFIFGNLLPDINNGYLIPNVSTIISHDITHYIKNGGYNSKEEFETMLNDYLDIYKLEFKHLINRPIIYGYFAHLLTDYYWNYKTYMEKGIFENGIAIGVYKHDGSVLLGYDEMIRKVKVDDFNIFSKYLYKNELKIQPFVNIDELAQKTKCITKVSINNEDIEYVNKYFETIDKKIERINAKYTIFTQKEMEEGLNQTVRFIKQTINN